MKSYWIVAAAFILAWPSGSTAYTGSEQSQGDVKAVQQAQAAPAANPRNPNPQNTGAQNKGSYLLVELSKTLKAKKLKPGDKIKAEISQDVISHGKIIIPMETEIIGHVTEVSVREGDTGESRLGFVFDRILLKHYHDINVQAVVQAVSAPVQRRSRIDEPSQMLPPSMMMGEVRQSPNTGSRSSSISGRSPTNTAPPSTAMNDSNANTNFQAPLTVKQSPTTHTGTGGSAARLAPSAPNGTSISVGTPQGVTGLKGLSLASSSDTPGPVVVSNTENVKLESGTQILLHILSVTDTQPPTGK